MTFKEDNDTTNEVTGYALRAKTDLSPNA
ncbi:MAG: hypothetical protein ACI9CZ_001273 [Flavobacterium sp.]